jgi:hypothetical protein
MLMAPLSWLLSDCYKNERPSFYASTGRFVNPAGA